MLKKSSQLGTLHVTRSRGQAVGLLDDLDKELNNFAMRLREWHLGRDGLVGSELLKTRTSSLAFRYGWHFPEMGKIVTENLAYAKAVRSFRTQGVVW